MPNYLERVASSAGRRAAIAKPPVSGPPVLPVGRDFAIAPEEEQFLETLETSVPVRRDERAEISLTPKLKIDEATTAAPQETTRAAPLEPKPHPRPTHERLSSDSPFTVHVPRTLRPITTANIPTSPVDEPPRVRASTTDVPEEFTINNESTPVVHSGNTDAATETTTADMPAQPKPLVVDQAPASVVRTEATPPDTIPTPRVDAPPRYSAEPLPPPAVPVHVPPAAGNATRQEQSRVHIGSLEVLVNNHPQVTRTRPAPAPSRTESLNLEKRYLDRFRLRH